MESKTRYNNSAADTKTNIMSTIIPYETAAVKRQEADL